MGSDEPRHAHKEVRELAAWLRGRGWEFDSVDAKGHPAYSWQGHRVSLPTSPRGNRWKNDIRRQALAAMGEKGRGKYRPRPYVAAQTGRARPGEALTQAQLNRTLAVIDAAAGPVLDRLRVNGRAGEAEWAARLVEHVKSAVSESA